MQVTLGFASSSSITAAFLAEEDLMLPTICLPPLKASMGMVWD
jgi:hypothetical protein